MNKKLPFFALICASFMVLAGCGNKGAGDSSAKPNTSPFSSVTPTSSTSSEEGEVASAAAKIASNATRDGVKVSASDLLSAASYQGNETLTKTRAFNLFYAAYHASMPEMIGIRKYGANVFPTPYSDVPSEATAAVKFLSDYGLLTHELDEKGEMVTTFNGEEAFASSSLATYIDRFHAYFGTSLHDDFANTVNYDYIYNNESRKDKTPDDDVYDTNIVSQKKVNDWVDSYYSGMASSDNKANLDRYAWSLVLSNYKTAGSCAGAYATYQQILDATDYASLFSTCASLYDKQGTDPLFSKIETDASMSLYGLSIGRVYAFMPSDINSTNFTSGSELYTSFVSQKTKAFKIIGIPETTAGDLASAMAKMLLSMIPLYEGYLQTLPAMEVYATTTKLGPQNFNLQDHLTAANVKLTPFDKKYSTDLGVAADAEACRYISRSPAAMHAFFESMSAENFLGAKAIALNNQILDYLPCNPDDAVVLLGNYTYSYMASTSMRERYFVPGLENGVITAYKETPAYRNNFALISKAILDLRQDFRRRINLESWLSDAGKAAAIKKVDQVKTSILASNDDASGIELPLPTYAYDTLYANIVAYQMNRFNYFRSHPDAMSFYELQSLCDPFTANATYSPNQNGITIYFGYLAAHNDFASMSTEQLYSDLYLCCGHELTHGFDTNGVNFDENGNPSTTWWGEADHTAYTNRVQSVINFYQGKEVMPGIMTNATTVISEACADCAGMRLTMDLAKNISDFDYKAFFTYAAQMFYSVSSVTAYYGYGIATDTHPFGRVRANCLVSSVNEFYDTLKIVEGEGMYTAPEARPHVW
jgi:hypothetical protein